MFLHPLFAATLAALLTLSLTSTSHAISFGQVDDFQDATLQGWDSGGSAGNPNPNPPLVGPICGPSGSCGTDVDHYALVIGSGAVGLPGHGVAIANSAQWAGDYLSAGVTSIQLDANNLGTTELHLRLAILSTSGGTFALTESIVLAPHGTGAGGWTTLSFDLDPAGWTSATGPVGMFPGTDIMQSLSSVSTLRILSSVEPVFQSDALAGTLALDNITAVPEPGTFALLAGGLALLARRRV